MEIKQTILRNGLKVISAPRPQIESVSFGIWVNTGSADENIEDNGISHFIEHMVFKGTKKRNSLQISEDIENVGGATNAYTSRHFTCFYAKMLKNDLELAADVICDFITDPLFDDGEMIKEKEVVVQEIKQSLDTPDDLVFDYFQETAFPNQASGRTILGPIDTVRNFTAERLRAHLKKHYTANNMIVACVGNVDHDKFVKMIEERMSGVNQDNSFISLEQKYVGGAKIEYKDIEQTHLVLGFEGASYLSEDYYKYSILSTIFGGGMSSRLFQEIREKRGLVYTINSFNQALKKAGVFGIYAGTTPKELNKLLPVVATEIKKLVNEKVSDCELNRAKTQIKASLLMSLESSSTTAEIMARQMLLFNRVIPTEELVAKIESVSKDDLQNIAQNIFTSNPTYALLGSSDVEYPSFEDVKNMLKLG
ncbi:MAG: insulinase family protein [Alphaproteobacteria bacterium]|nr:insulinase family protein [Alphaproteobacteria bacterium]